MATARPFAPSHLCIILHLPRLNPNLAVLPNCKSKACTLTVPCTAHKLLNWPPSFMLRTSLSTLSEVWNGCLQQDENTIGLEQQVLTSKTMPKIEKCKKLSTANNYVDCLADNFACPQCNWSTELTNSAHLTKPAKANGRWLLQLLWKVQSSNQQEPGVIGLRALEHKTLCSISVLRWPLKGSTGCQWPPATKATWTSGASPSKCIYGKSRKASASYPTNVCYKCCRVCFFASLFPSDWCDAALLRLRCGANLSSD